MSFFNPAKNVKAKIEHRCTNCCEPILVGDTYMKWTSVDETWFTSKMHPECFEDTFKYDNEYTPYSGERPERRVRGEK